MSSILFYFCVYGITLHCIILRFILVIMTYCFRGINFYRSLNDLWRWLEKKMQVISKNNSWVSEKESELCKRSTPPTRGWAVAYSTRMSEPNDNTSRWPLSCNPTTSDLRLHVRCWETFNCPIDAWVRRLHSGAQMEPQTKSRQTRKQQYVSVCRLITFQPWKKCFKNISPSLFFCSGEKNIWHEYVSFKSPLYRRGQKAT